MLGEDIGEMYTIFLVIIFVILAGIGLFNSIFELDILSIGYPVGYMNYSGIYVRYILFIISLVFILPMCVSALKKIYIHGG